eukprot:5765956-Pyramimonas_sp.AAC.1
MVTLDPVDDDQDLNEVTQGREQDAAAEASTSTESAKDEAQPAHTSSADKWRKYLETPAKNISEVRWRLRPLSCLLLLSTSCHA